MFETVFTDEFEDLLFDIVEEQVGPGGRRFLEEHNQDWRGYKAIIRAEASKKGVDVDDISQETIFKAVVDHLREFEEAYELNTYSDQ